MREILPLLVLVVIISACVGGEQSGPVQDSIKEIPEVKAFLAEHKATVLDVKLVPQGEMISQLVKVKSYCSDITLGSYYKATAVDADSQKTFIAWIDAKDNKFICSNVSNIKEEKNKTDLPTTLPGQPSSTASNTCAIPHGMGNYVNGQCSVVSCNSGYYNCDKNNVNGCESTSSCATTVTSGSTTSPLASATTAVGAATTIGGSTTTITNATTTTASDGTTVTTSSGTVTTTAGATTTAAPTTTAEPTSSTTTSSTTTSSTTTTIAQQTFGLSNCAGGTVFSTQTNYKFASKFTLPNIGTVSKLTMYTDGGGSGSGSQVMKGIIYADSGGSPGALKGTTGEVTITKSQSVGWIDMTFSSPVALAAGDYWLGMIAGNSNFVTRFFFKSLASGKKFAADTYTDGASNPFGSSSTTDGQICIYATYT